MRFGRTAPLLAISLFLGYTLAQDILTPALTPELVWEWTNHFQSCVRALQLHGEGKDDDAVDLLSRHAQNNNAVEHFQIAKTKPNDGFWKQVVSAGSYSPDCEDYLSDILDLHFYWKPKSLGNASDDAATSHFLALYDLLWSIPANGFDATPVDWDQDRPTVANVYRYCFASDEDALIAMINRKLGRKK